MEEKQFNKIIMNVLLIAAILYLSALVFGNMLDWSLHIGERLFSFARRFVEHFTI
ncbi:hypothetical protein RJP21_11455 [Paenibacillus sp. VCA1]|uniref:hypothetical protein n=1 Tax=Paenibacillus sp. VCA1 TaxID=3039148 RepID=UPI00287206EA|nr:hypothetical protein [Paenibacillus sp. VCA1]MDR9854218.1 hypothetical protein [Paenibacillus sp. VCA1]